MENYLARMALAFILGLIMCLIAMPKYIAWAKKVAVQPIYEDAPKSHAAKAKTPTMGGLVFIICALISGLICAKFSLSFYAGVIVLAGFCALGFIDDFNKIKGANNHAGLSAKAKMLGCLVISFIASILHYKGVADTKLMLPGLKIALFDMGILAVVFWMLVMISSANAINLTDGLDGLASTCSLISLGFLIALGVFGCYEITSVKFNLTLSATSAELYVLAASLMGSLTGFLWFNAHPAEVFMGDTGSLSLGAFMGFVAISAHNELLLVLIGLVFVAETLSVIIQVFSFRVFKRRVFKMSPLHHHFEQLGWAEAKVYLRFCLVAFLCGAIGFIIQII